MFQSIPIIDLSGKIPRLIGTSFMDEKIEIDCQYYDPTFRMLVEECDGCGHYLCKSCKSYNSRKIE
jgi:hypothetical protein